LGWGVVTPIAKKVHIVERNLAKLTNVFLGLFAVQMTHSRSLHWKAFSSLIAVGAFANTFPWFVRAEGQE
ncbi:MAG: hypothetical protein JSR80_04615, partial [Verrucomicrobia bacterium]|nr:hypothetical protein [Verrucomicrobiota bacterium]